MKSIPRLTVILLAALSLVSAPALAQPQPVNLEKVAALLRNDLGVWAGCLSVRETVFAHMSASEEQAGRQFITILNSNSGCYSISEDGRLVLHHDVLRAIQPSDTWSEVDVLKARVIAEYLYNPKVCEPPGGVSLRAVWYEYQLLSTSDYNDSHNYRDTDRVRHPLPVSLSTTVTYQSSISGGASVPISVLLAWLKLEFVGTWTQSKNYGPYTPKGPNDPSSAYYPRGEEAEIWHTDYHFHSSASYYQWYCTDEDIKGKVTRWFQGTYTATGYKFDHRTYWLQLYACHCNLCG